MIPKKIHYCWFGKQPLPRFAKKCISSWQKYLPDYEIKEWNETNFNVELFPYAKEAYDSHKYAFVSDVARLYALYNEGGIYLDTDIEIIKTLDTLLDNEAFSGFEMNNNITTGIMASIKGGKWVKDILEYYKSKHFILSDGKMDLTPNPIIVTNYLLKNGLKKNNTFQNLPGIITIYPKDYFCPLENHKLVITVNTICIHHYEGSWFSGFQRFKRLISRLLGHRLSYYISKFIR